MSVPSFESPDSGRVQTGMADRRRGSGVPRIEYDRNDFRGALILNAVNILLIVVTLTLYRFWAVTRARHLVWSKTSFDGVPFEYTGTGIEVFIGFLKVFFLFLLPMAVIAVGLQYSVSDGGDLSAIQAVDFVSALALLLLFEIGRFLSWRYRASRTRWRGIRSRIDAAVKNYLTVAICSAATWLITGGLLKGLVDVWRAKFLIENFRYGSQKAEFKGEVTALLWSWIGYLLLIGLALSVGFAPIIIVFVSAGAMLNTGELPNLLGGGGLMLLLGLFSPLLALWPYFAYRARFWRYVCANTILGPVSFGFRASGWQLMWLTVINWLILIVSLGFLAPIVWRRRVEFAARHLTIAGEFDLATLRQIAESEAGITGEGLAGDFGVF